MCLVKNAVSLSHSFVLRFLETNHSQYYFFLQNIKHIYTVVYVQHIFSPKLNKMNYQTNQWHNEQK